MFDVGNQQDRERLHKAIKTSWSAVDTFRAVRTELVRDYVGSWYSTAGARRRTDVNMLNQTARIYTMALVFNNPQVKVTSFNPKLWPFCRKYEVNINRGLANIDFRTTFQAGVLDAFFLMGIFNVRMADSGFVELEDNVWVDPGKPWVDRISLDDVILDMSAKDIRAMRFIGHQYRASYDAVRDRDDYDRKVLDRLTPTSKSGVDSSSDRASEIAAGQAVDDDELGPMVWLKDVYLPGTRQLTTFCGDDDALPPLKVAEWDGSAMGPYKVLSLGIVPDNIMPSSPAQNLKGLHDLGNRLYRKLSAQAERQKNIVGVPAGSEDDGRKAKDAKDGEYPVFRDPKALVPISFPGVDGNTNAFFLAVQEVYNDQAGNQRMIGGLGKEADTVGQERIISSHAGGLIGFMKGAVNACASEICREYGNLMFDDEAMTVDSYMEAENTGYYMDSSWRPGDRAGLKSHYDFCVEPNSMSYRPPEAKLQQIMGYLQAVGTVFPLVQAGILDLQELTKLASEYENIPELQRIFKFIPQSAGEGMGDPHAATKPPVTSREIVRNNGAQGPQGGGMAAMFGQMMQGRGQGNGSGVTVGGGA